MEIKIEQIQIMSNICKKYNLDVLQTLDHLITEEGAIHIQELIRYKDPKWKNGYFYLALGRIQEYYKSEVK